MTVYFVLDVATPGAPCFKRRICFGWLKCQYLPISNGKRRDEHPGIPRVLSRDSGQTKFGGIPGFPVPGNPGKQLYNVAASKDHYITQREEWVEQPWRSKKWFGTVRRVDTGDAIGRFKMYADSGEDCTLWKYCASERRVNDQESKNLSNGC